MVLSDSIRLRSGSAQRRRKAIERLTATGKLPGLKLLIASLSDPDAHVRLAAAQVLQQQADPAHLPHFLTLLVDEHFEVRLTAIQFLRRINDPQVVQALVARLADSDSDVRRAAAAALGVVRSPVALEPLVLSLTDEEPAVRHAAAAALEEIDPRWVRTDAAQRAIPRLGALRGDPRPWIATAAETVLEKLRAAKDRDTEVWKRESGIRTL
jgi:HEAT repeat protein